MAAPRFRLVLVRPPGYAHSSALLEALEYLAIVLCECGAEADIAENELRRTAHNVIACAHLLPIDVVSELPTDTIVFQSEPLAHADGWQFSPAYRAALERFYLWDYSAANLSRLPHQHVDVIPFWYRRELLRAIPREVTDRVLFYGALTPHRRGMLDALAAAGVEVATLFGVYGEARDRELRRARVILDLRNRATSATFASLRCFHALINEVPVIAEEPGDDPSALPFRDAVTFVPTERFAAETAALLVDREGFAARTKAQLAAFATRDPVPAMRTILERYLNYTSTTTSR